MGSYKDFRETQLKRERLFWFEELAKTNASIQRTADNVGTSYMQVKRRMGKCGLKIGREVK
jgi:hypothetical protein